MIQAGVYEERQIVKERSMTHPIKKPATVGCTGRALSAAAWIHRAAVVLAIVLVPAVSAHGGDIVTSDRIALTGSTTFGSANAILWHPYDERIYFANDAPANATPAGGIYRILANGTVELVVGADRPAGLALDDFSLDLYFTEDAGGGVYRSPIVDYQTSTYGPPVGVADLVPGEDQTTGVTIVHLDYNGPYPASEHGMVSDPGTDYLIQFNTDTYPDPGSATPLQQDTGTDWVSLTSNDRHIYLADASAATGGVYEIGALVNGSYLTRVDDAAVLVEPVGVAVGKCSRTIYVTTQAQDALYALDPLTGAAELLASGFTDLEPNSVAVNWDGDTIWVSDRGTSTIYEFAVVPRTTVIRYTLQDVTFDDGGTVSGFFDFDPTLPPNVNCVAGWSENYEITVSGGDTGNFPPYTYTDEEFGPITSGGGIADQGIRFFTFGNTGGQVGGRRLNIGVAVETWALGSDLTIPLVSSPGNSTEFRLVSLSPLMFASRLIMPGGTLVGAPVDLCPGFDDGEDADTDGVPDGCDLCPNTIPGAPVNADGCPHPAIPADFDNDGDVDIGDFVALAACLEGPGVTTSVSCVSRDLDVDSDVDLADFARFQHCYSGAGIPGVAGCNQ